ncbi:MAG: helix-turn-helix domain-containing protein [Acidimicrobiia bacterium]
MRNIAPDRVADLIRSSRQEVGLSQMDLAERVGSKQSVVSRWETGADEPRLSTLVRVLGACGLSLSLAVDQQESVDRSQIRQQLALTPDQRLASVANLSRLLASARRVE